jgi:two-component system response regulator WspF
MKIGIVNDLPLAVEALRRTLAFKPEHHVIWVAHDGAQAVERCAQTPADLVLMDMIMPGMDGVEATRRIMAGTPCPILVVTVSVGANSARVFEAMGHGALDAVDTPVLKADDPRASVAPFLKKIDSIAGLISAKGLIQKPDTVRVDRTGGRVGRERLVAIGASAGGPAALAKVLGALPKDFPAAIVIVQHVDERFADGMAEWLSRDSALPVRVAQEGDRPTVGTVLLAGTNDHLRLTAADRLGYTAEPREQAYRPSVDVFFESVSMTWPGEAVGVLLTGMGRDGAIGLKALRNKGHYTIAQNQATSAVYGMPKAAVKLNAAVDILPIERIAPRLAFVFNRNQSVRER